MEANTDALRGRGPHYRLNLRQASAHEPIAALRNPVFTNCTLPVIIVADFLYNMGEFFAKVLTAVDLLSTMSLDDKVTLVLQTPMGLHMAAFHSLFLMPYSRYPAITASELGGKGCSDPRDGGTSSSRDGCEPAGDEDPVNRDSTTGCRTHRAVPWSIEPQQPHCFERTACPLRQLPNCLSFLTFLRLTSQKVVILISQPQRHYFIFHPFFIQLNNIK
ncbi:hypothetical protein VOLCADRAFT_92501 [Volvox carteri f. nagariensis]|uniref:Uncharacterized protein n=1 Tax=Volvox carteri f. nagariensis TaxID=3068 RepID=D8TZT9_VOLCA|nr:uncharacterized protein VOLCADRAFT_92501 [Volvox carteri f. nagariensis]EFJ47073.1 hypothetical protein VOLCADRAFT_92501 [Volvox carteri f. nagariensis]|eukprot:XP_002951968.1 hypothetical protein VOLCADRAFT_92501 [Volvox carteri f. nagariensis]